MALVNRCDHSAGFFNMTFLSDVVARRLKMPPVPGFTRQ